LIKTIGIKRMEFLIGVKAQALGVHNLQEGLRKFLWEMWFTKFL